MKIWFFMLATLLISLPLWAEGMRCGRQLVSEGDSKYKLESICGEPVARESYEDIRHVKVRGLHGHSHWSAYPVVVEKWTFDLGSTRFTRIVTLEKGVITRIETGDRP